jgi:hypothetical protein
MEEIAATEKSRLCEQIWTIRRFTSALFVPAYAGCINKTLEGSGHTGNFMLAP